MMKIINIPKSILFLILFQFTPPLALAKFKMPEDFKTMNQMIANYLKQHHLIEEAEVVKKQAVLYLFKSLNFLENSDDAFIFDYALWEYPKEAEQILKDETFNFHLSHIIDELEKAPPAIMINGCHGHTPLGGLTAKIKTTTSYYGILKFIGQYTNNRNIFNSCIKTAEFLRDKIDGPIATIDEILFLMAENKNLQNLPSFPRPRVALFHKKKDFKTSIYRPAPCQSEQYDEVKKRFGNGLSKLDSLAAKVLLVKELMSRHFYLPSSLEEGFGTVPTKVFYDYDFELTINQRKQLITLAEEIFDESAHLLPQIDEAQLAKKSALEIIAGLRLEDSSELTDIISMALIYHKDDIDAHPRELDKKLAFEEIFKSKIVPVDSDMAHFAIRQASVFGRVWALKFLIEQGVSFNPPPYHKFRIWLNPINQLSPLELASSKFHSKNGPHLAAINFLTQAGAKF